MNLSKSITVNGERQQLENEDVRLNLFTPGRAVFVVNSSEPMSGIVSFSLGFDINKLVPFFIGYIESSTTINEKQQRIYCRELTATLNRRLALNLRGVTLNETLEEISKDTALVFVTPKAAYADVKVPSFYSCGNGYHVMDSMSQVFNIPKMIWQQQGDGKIFVGGLDDSFWNGRNIDVPLKWQKTIGISNRSTIPVVPRLRPGALFNGQVLTALKLQKNEMSLIWNKDPWAMKAWARK